MRVALIQVNLDPSGRAANLQRLLASIRVAATQSPAPDLLILPGRCDGTQVGSRVRGWRAMCQIVRETLSWQARDWGLYIAAGLHYPNDRSWAPASVLFDPDGDEMIAVRPAGEHLNLPNRSAVVSCETLVGRIGVGLPFLSLDDLSSHEWDEGGTFLAIPTNPADEGGAVTDCLSRIRVLQAKLGGERAVYWGVTSPAQEGNARSRRNVVGSTILDPLGNVVVVADTVKERIVYADIDLISPACSAGDRGSALDGHAT